MYMFMMFVMRPVFMYGLGAGFEPPTPFGPAEPSDL